jgi:hypothetical protein
MGSLYRVRHIRQGIFLVKARSDALCGEPVVCGECLEQSNNLLEVRDSFRAFRAVGRKARRPQGGITSPMVIPFVLRNYESGNHESLRAIPPRSARLDRGSRPNTSSCMRACRLHLD